MEKHQRRITKPELDVVFEALYGKRYKVIEGCEETEYDDDDADCIVLSD